MKKQKNYFLILFFLSLILFLGHRVLGGDNLDGTGPSCPEVGILACNGCNCAPQTVSCTCTRESDDVCLSDCANSVSDCTANCSSASQDCLGDCAEVESACLESLFACLDNCESGADFEGCKAMCHAAHNCTGPYNLCCGACNSAYGTCQSVCNSAYASCSSGCWYTSTNCPESSCSGPDDCCPPETCTYVVCVNGQNQTRTGTVPCPDDAPCPDTCTYVVCVNGQNQTRTGTVPCPDDAPCPDTCTYVVCVNGANQTKTGTPPCPDDAPCSGTCTYVVCVNGQNQTRTGTIPCPADDPCPDEETCTCLVCNVNKKCRSKTYFGSACPCDDLCESDLDCESSTTTTSKPPVLPCMISDFTINGKTNKDQNPIRVWLNQLLTGKWSTNFYCIDCNIDCAPNGCNWSKNYIGTYGSEKFKITQKGDYNYTLTCWGENKDEDTATLSLTVKALSFPYWREIIPVLPGFLRGLFNR